MLQELFNVLSPVVICIGLGWVWGRLDKPFDARGLSELVTLVATPCLVFSTLTRIELDPRLLGDIGLAHAVALCLFGIIGALVLKVSGLPQRTYLPPLMFGNVGNMGLPLSLLAFGDHGLALAVVVFTVGSVANFTFGVWLYSGTTSPWRLLRMPLLHAVFLALMVMVLDLSVPEWIDSTTSLLGEFAIPILMLTLGVSLARLEVMNVRRALGISVLRVGMGIAVGWLVAVAFGLEGAARGVLILQCSMPVAVFNYLFSVRYNRDPEVIAGLIVVSTLVALVVLPVLLTVIM